jgi:NADPH:quinone reductase-like Zn-dependent oxidoreductase
MYAMAQESFRSAAPLVRIELPDPEPRAGCVRVRVHAISVNPVDWKMRSSGPLRLAARVIRIVRGPRKVFVPGVDFAGIVDAVGRGVTDFQVGQRVFGGCNFSRGQHGSYADTVVVRSDQLCALPDGVAFEIGASLPVAGVTAWMSLTEFRPIGPGRRALILGASGAVGQLAVQLAKRTRNADIVVGVCSKANVERVRGLGADIVLDYTAGDPLAAAQSHGPYDVVIDCAGGYKASRCRALLAKSGKHVMVAGDTPGAIAQIFIPPFRSRAILGAPTTARLRAVVDAVAAKQVEVTIAARMQLNEVERAHEQSRGGRMTGKLILLP